MFIESTDQIFLKQLLLFLSTSSQGCAYRKLWFSSAIEVQTVWRFAPILNSSFFQTSLLTIFLQKPILCLATIW